MTIPAPTHPDVLRLMYQIYNRLFTYSLSYQHFALAISVHR